MFQQVQFIAIFVHSFQLLFRECNYPHGFMWWIGFHAVLFWFLFADFYKNTYGKRGSRSKAALNGKAVHSESRTNGVNGTNGYHGGNGLHKTNGVVSNGTSNGTTNGYSKPSENGYKNGTNGHSNGFLVHRTATSKEE